MDAGAPIPTDALVDAERLGDAGALIAGADAGALIAGGALAGRDGALGGDGGALAIAGMVSVLGKRRKAAGPPPLSVSPAPWWIAAAASAEAAGAVLPAPGSGPVAARLATGVVSSGT